MAGQTHASTAKDPFRLGHWSNSNQVNSGGVTNFGGQPQTGFPSDYQGVAFKLDLTSSGSASYHVVSQLQIANDGFVGPNPVSGFVAGADGNLYAVLSGASLVGQILSVNPNTAAVGLYPNLGFIYYLAAGIDVSLYASSFEGIVGEGALFGLNKLPVFPSGAPIDAINGDAESAPPIQTGDLKTFDTVNSFPNFGYNLRRGEQTTNQDIVFAYSKKSVDPGFPNAIPQLVAEPGCYTGGTCRIWGLAPNTGPRGSLFYSGENLDFTYVPINATDFVPSSAALLWTSANKLVMESHSGGKFGMGGLYQYDPGTGTFSKLLDFQSNEAASGLPVSSLVQGSDGRLYGVLNNATSYAYNSAPSCIDFNTQCGLIYAVDLGLPGPAPLIAGFYSHSNTPGSQVLLRGFNFLNTQSVSLNGEPCTYKVVNSQTLSVTLPSSASTGDFVVTTPNGTATSTNPFIVE